MIEKWIPKGAGMRRFVIKSIFRTNETGGIADLLFENSSFQSYLKMSSKIPVSVFESQLITLLDEHKILVQEMRLAFAS